MIGTQLAKELAKKEEVVILDFDPRPPDKFKDFNIRVKKGDVSNISHIINVLKEYHPRRIFHLASMLSLPSESDPWSALNVNAKGVYNILEASRIIKTPQVIFSSSRLASSCPEVQDKITDFSLQRPRTIYGISKVFGELLGRYYGKFGLDFRGVRFSTVIGPGVKSMGVTRCFPLAIEAAVKGEEFNLWVEDETKVSLLYYKDAVNALINLSDALQSNIRTEVYNVVGVEPLITAKEFVQRLTKRYPDARISIKPDYDILKTRGKMVEIDDSKAKGEWGWSPTFDLEQIFEDFEKEMGSNE